MKGIWARLPTRGQSGGIWRKLSYIPVKAFDPNTFNLWTMFGNRPGGMWHELEDETLLLSSRRALDLWQELNDETLIIRPRVNIWQEIASASVTSGDLGFWDDLGQETLVLAKPKATIWSLAVVRDFTRQKPARRLGWALKKLQTSSGEEYYILKNLRAGTYMRLTEEQVFLWELMDGEHTIQDMAIAYFMRFKSMAIKSLFVFLGQLEARGFLVESRANLYASTTKGLRGWSLGDLGPMIMRIFSRLTLSIGGIDRFLNVIYRAGVFLVYKRAVQVLMLVTTLVGMAAFGYHAWNGSYSVITGGGEYLSLGLLGLYIAQALAVLLHEAAHAFTVKYYGREVRRAGIMIYLGMPAFFVDTTDIWMEPRRPRLLVSWAGPYSGFFLAGVASLLIFISPSAFVSGLLFQFAFACCLISFTNLNPLLRLDGYYILMDWLEIPMLRGRALQFVQGELWKKLRQREKFNREERIFSVFGLLSLGWTLIIVFSMLRLFGGSILAFLQELLGNEMGFGLMILLALGLGIILLWPLLRGLIIKKRRAAV
jgi:putative peptide zinc metalloprotease protein